LKVGTEEASKTLEITPEELSFQIERAHYLSDYEYFASERLWIVNKDGKLIRFAYNEPQKKLNQAIEKQRIAGKPVRICLLKARQWGGTTKIEGVIFGDTILRTSRSSMIIAHSMESAEHIRSMSERYYDRYSLEKPRLRKQTEKWWKFLHTQERKNVESSIRIDTAENLAAGHSFTLHNLHCSEIQTWPHAEEIVKGLFPTVPNSIDTMIFMEGTGTGVGSYWYDFCQMAQDSSSDWEFVFVPWFEISDYKLALSEGEAERLSGSLDDDEQALLRTGASLEALKWRRRAVRESYKGDLDSFHQQYPSTPDEAFLVSGRPVFPAGMVKKKMLDSLEGETGNLRWKKDGDTKSVVWDSDPRGFWTKWETPVRGTNLYTCGADVAEGIAVVPELGNRGGDFSAARILRRDTRKMVATFHARVDPDLFADELAKASFYWDSPIFPEQNAGGGGSLVISRLRDVRGVRLLKTPVFGKKREEQKENEVGWETFRNTKRIAIDELTEAIRESAFEDLDKRLWYECSTYVRDEKGRTNAQPRKYDDLVMATAITLQADKLMSMAMKYQGESPLRSITRDMDIPRKQRGALTQESVMADNLAEF
jgi:hypothetical protein